MVMMEPYFNVCDNRPNTDEILDRVVPTDVTKEASAENMRSVQAIQVR